MLMWDVVRDSCLSSMNELKRKLDDNNAKILFAGHRGSGKSTEINRLEKEIAEKDFCCKVFCS